MRDKDAHLIFESYRNRVILNEAAPALAIPAAGIGIAQILGLAATAVGATALASEIAKKEDQISRMFTLTPSTESVVEKIGSIIQANDTSVRGLYGALNYAKSLNVPALSNIIDRNLNSLDILKSLQDGTLDINQSVDYIKSEIFTIQESSRELMDLALKTNVEALIGVIGEATKGLNKALRETNALNNRLLDIIERGGGGGGEKEPDDKDPNKKSKIWEILKAIYNNLTSLKLYIAIGILILAGVIITGYTVGAKELGRMFTGAAKGAVGAAGEFAEGGMEELKSKGKNDSSSGSKYGETRFEKEKTDLPKPPSGSTSGSTYGETRFVPRKK